MLEVSLKSDNSPTLGIQPLGESGRTVSTQKSGRYRRKQMSALFHGV